MTTTGLKTRFFEILLLAGLFAFSVFFRSPNLYAPPSQQYEWMSSHVLVTMKVWDQTGGPSQSHFAPRYTFPGEGNRSIGLGHLPGLFDADGHYYYISYPSLGFLLPYYFFEWTGAEKNHYSLRVFGIALHAVLMLLLYWFLLELSGEKSGNGFAFYSVTGTLIYVFSKVYLWSHMNFYFADSLMQLFFLMQAFLLLRLMKTEHAPGFLSGCVLFVVFLLGACCDWFGVLTTLAAAWILYKKTPERNTGVRYLLILGGAVVAALLITFFQYSSIAGAETFWKAISGKMLLRSGWSDNELTTEGLSYFHSASYIRLASFFWYGFGMFLIPVLLLLFVFLFFKDIRNRLNVTQKNLLLFFIFPVLLHLVLLFNFNAVHDYSVMKYGFFFILLWTLLCPFLREKMPFRNSYPVLMVVFILAAIAQNLYRYQTEYSKYDSMHVLVGEKIRNYARPDEVVFINKGYYYNPSLEFFSGRNISSKGNPKLALRKLKSMGMQKALFVYIGEPFADTLIRLDTLGNRDYVYPVKGK